MIKLQNKRRLRDGTAIAICVLAPVLYLVWAKVNSIEYQARRTLDLVLDGNIGILEQRMLPEEAALLGDKKLEALWDISVRPRLAKARRTHVVSSQGVGPLGQEVSCDEGLVLDNGRPYTFTLQVDQTESGPKMLVAHGLLVNAWLMEYSSAKGYVKRTGDVARAARVGLAKDMPALKAAGIDRIVLLPGHPAQTLDDYYKRIERSAADFDAKLARADL